MTASPTSPDAGLRGADRQANVEASQPNQRQPITITISRESEAGGSEIAHELARRLNWPLYNRKLIEKITTDPQVRQQLLEELGETLPNWVEACLTSFSPTGPRNSVELALRLRELLFALYCHGNCIILGRGAAQVLPSDQTLRVRLISPKLHRIRRAARRLGILEEGARDVAAIDRERVEFVGNHFHKNPADVHSYDLIIDTSRFTTGHCADMILVALKARQEIQASAK
ncbi:MAG: AAA family ATPase [Bythopirellula sp.]